MAQILLAAENAKFTARRSRNQSGGRRAFCEAFGCYENQTPTPTHGVPDAFLSKFGQHVTAVLSGFDRLRFRATLRMLFVPAIMETYLSVCHVLIKNFKTFAEATTARIKAAAYASAQAAGRPALYLPSSEIWRRRKLMEKSSRK